MKCHSEVGSSEVNHSPIQIALQGRPTTSDSSARLIPPLANSVTLCVVARAHVPVTPMSLVKTGPQLLPLKGLSTPPTTPPHLGV